MRAGPMAFRAAARGVYGALVELLGEGEGRWAMGPARVISACGC